MFIKTRTLFSFCLCLFLTVISHATPPTPNRQKISQYLKSPSTQEQQLSLLEQIVNINSGTNNIAGVHKVGEILRPLFEKLGFSTEWVEEPASMHRAGTLIARHLGQNKDKKGKRLLLIGHLDTVFPKDGPFQRFSRKGNYAFGPGVIDDKGGDVVILYALQALRQAGALDDATITVVLTGDEEDSGKPTSISRKPLLLVAKQNDIALDFECAMTMDTATIARRGISSWTIKAEGSEGHASEIFQEKLGFGAIFEIARIFNTMQQELSKEQYLTFNPGLIVGGTRLHYDSGKSFARVFGRDNVIAKEALAIGDLRFIDDEQKTKAENAIKDIVNKHLPGTTASIHFSDGIPAMSPTKANLELLNQYSSASEALGYGKISPLDPSIRGAGDISHIAAFVQASLAGLGPLGTGGHSIDETMDISSLPIQTERAALLMYQLTRIG